MTCPVRLLAALLTLSLAACSPAGLLNASVPHTGYRVERDLAYAAGERHRLDVYVPDHLAQPAPVIVFFYGGSWQMGDKGMYRFLGQAFASEGFLTVVPDYRVYPAVRFPAYMKDAAQAFAWTQAHIASYGGDAGSVFVAGHSAGGQIAALLALDPEYLRAAGRDPSDIRGLIGLSGPYDFLPLTDPVLKIIFGQGDLRRSQPIHFADGVFSGGAKPPSFLATGDDDDSVYPKNSYHLAQALKAAGNDVTLRTYPGLGHIGMILSFADGFRNRSPALADVAAFVRAHSSETASPPGQ